MISGLKMLSSCKGCSAFVDCLLFGISIYLIHANVSYLFLRRMPICGQDVKFSTNPMKLSAKIILWSRQLLPLRSVWRCGASVAAFLARKLGKLGSLITWRFATAKFPTGNIESWNFITTCIEGVNIHIYWWRKGCKACHSSTHSGKISGSRIGSPVHCLVPSILSFTFCSAKERLAVISQIIRSSFFGWVYCLSRLIASRLELRASLPRFVNSLYLLCYVSRTFCSALSRFCWQTTCKTYCYAQYGERTEKQSTGHSFSSTSCYWNYKVLSQVSLVYYRYSLLNNAIRPV